jgi:Leucine-rich repeat (LRR) protein
LREVPKESALAKLDRLSWLNMDGNRLSSLDGDSLPGELQTLSASRNSLREFPGNLLDRLKNLAWLYLRDNQLRELPPFPPSRPRRLEKMDLGENRLEEVGGDAWAGGLKVRDLNLDYNRFTLLPPSSFGELDPGRIYLSWNRIKTINESAFDSVENLEYLDVGGNLLESLPGALSSLTKLRYLYAPSNNISRVSSDAFLSFSSTLSALSLSGNKLVEMPRAALANCTALVHLNLGYNSIGEISEEDFAGWAGELDTLLLMNNGITQLKGNTFRGAPRLRELSLSFNKITETDSDSLADLAKSLESLEVSFALFHETFPEDLVKPLESALWLALDNNEFRTISPTALASLGNVRYLNLEGNKLGGLPTGLLRGDIHTRLRDVRLGYNRLRSVDPHAFSGLEDLQTVVLTGNHIRNVKPNAFKELPSPLTVLLSDNRVSSISPRSFADLANLVRLDLQSNYLVDFSLSAFYNSTNPELPMTLNLSRNDLTSLSDGDTVRPVSVKVLDLSHNKLNRVPKEFLEGVRHSLRRLYLGYNRVGRLEEVAFGHLEGLQSLRMEHNGIISLRKRAFVGLRNLQLLDLSHNHVEQVHMEQFRNLASLRWVDLSHNHVRSIPRDAFQNTKLEYLDISHNEFVVLPSGPLGEVNNLFHTLRKSDILVVLLHYGGFRWGSHCGHWTSRTTVSNTSTAPCSPRCRSWSP